VARPTGFEPAISSVTGRRDRPLHYGRISVYTIVPATRAIKTNRGKCSKSRVKKQLLLTGSFYEILRRLRFFEWIDINLDVLELHLYVSCFVFTVFDAQ
jgi:hypothetical protein